MNGVRDWIIKIDDSFCEYEYHLIGGNEYSIDELIQIIVVHARMNVISSSLVVNHAAEIAIHDDYMNWNLEELIGEIKRLAEENQLYAENEARFVKKILALNNKVANLHKVISKLQTKVARQKENITTLLHLYTSGKRSKSHKKLREKYRALKARMR